MAIRTLTGHLGSMGSIDPDVVARLGCMLVNRELLEASHSFSWSDREIAAFDARTGGQGSHLARFLREWVEQMRVTDLDVAEMGSLAASTYREAAVDPAIRGAIAGTSTSFRRLSGASRIEVTW